jgi:hypothetical protein
MHASLQQVKVRRSASSIVSRVCPSVAQLVRDVLADGSCAAATRFMFVCFVTEQLEGHLIPQGMRVLVLEAQLEASNHKALPNKPTYSVAALLKSSIVVMTACAALMAGCGCAAISSWAS